MSKINTQIIDDQLVINIDIESIKFQVENHPMGFIILDDNKFMEYLVNNINNNDKLDLLFDDVALEAYENGEVFIETKED